MIIGQLKGGRTIELDRCYAEIDRRLEQSRIIAQLRAAASKERQGRRWFVLRTANRGEKAVENELLDAGIEAWVPVKRVFVQVRHTARMVERKRTVFRGYVFVKVTPCAQAWAGLKTFPSVAGIVCGHDGPMPVRDKKMDDLMALVVDGVFDEKRAKGPFRQGERVIIKSGAFTDFEGVLKGYVGTRGARVLTHLFGGEVVCEVPLAKLCKAA